MNRLNRLLLPCLAPAVVAVSLGCAATGETPLYRVATAPTEERVADLLRRMTVEEKATLLNPNFWDTKPIERLGIPQLLMVNGSYGVRSGRSTAFGTGVNLAATWNPELVHEVGVALGRELRAKGHNTLLGPVIYMHRIPQAGRNAESFSEDPLLAGEIVTAYIRGIQSQRVIATAALFGCKAQEHGSHFYDARVDERTIHEIYLPAYKMAVEQAGVWALMTAYNRVNGTLVSNHPELLSDIVKQRWGFPGLIMTDWAGVQNFEASVHAGLDLDMPYGRGYTTEKVIATLKNEKANPVLVERLNDSVRRILRAMFANGLFDAAPPAAPIDLDAHHALARQVARESITLLKNERGLLPLKLESLKSIAVIGPNAHVARHSILGASRVLPVSDVSPLAGISRLVSERVTVRHSSGGEVYDSGQLLDDSSVKTPDGRPGFQVEYFNDTGMTGAPLLTTVTKDIGFIWMNRPPVPGLDPDRYGVRITGIWTPPRSGRYTFAIAGGDLRRFTVGDTENRVRPAGQVEDWEVSRVQEVKERFFEAGTSWPIRLETGKGTRGINNLELRWKFHEEKPLENAIQAARESDVVVMCLGFSETTEAEERDRPPGLPENQRQLLDQIVAVNTNVIVVLTAGSGLEMEPWQNSVPAILHGYYPGQEGGIALAEILFGQVNPSGRLPATCLKRWEDSPVFGHYPQGPDQRLHFVEGIYVGYRWFDRPDTPDAALPFGHGLSYTTFEYTDATVTPAVTRTGNDVVFTVKVRNSGSRAGSEVVQLYVGDDHASVDRPVKELRHFRKVQLQPGETTEVRFQLRIADLCFYDTRSHAWRAEPGTFTLFAGSSSRDIRARRKFELRSTLTPDPVPR